MYVHIIHDQLEVKARQLQTLLIQQSLMLDQPIELDESAIDTAPFQLVQGTSLYKLHTLFSLLGLSHAYVTNCGQLIGVIALKEVLVVSCGDGQRMPIFSCEMHSRTFMCAVLCRCVAIDWRVCESLVTYHRMSVFVNQ
jgi:hypothetical protein